MPKFYFHLSNCDECFPDDIGYDLPDIAAAHTRAKRLARLPVWPATRLTGVVGPSRSPMIHKARS